MEKFESVALLVDGDNISAKFSAQILEQAGNISDPSVRRVYCNTQRQPTWDGQPEYRVIHAGGSKNGADVLLAMDGIELALNGKFDAFAIASSDGDFSHLAHRIREMGFHVLGIGEEKAPKSFQAACSHFHQLTNKVEGEPNMDLDELDQKIMQVIREMDTQGIGALITNFNAQIRRRFGVKISEQPEKKWAPYFKKRPELYAITGEGQDRRVQIAVKTE